MPVKAEVIVDLGLFLTSVSGKVDDEIAFRFQEAITSFPNYNSKLNTLLDVRLLDQNLLSPDSLVNLAANTPFDSSVKRAYVVNSEINAMLATLFGSTTSDNDHFFITYNIDDACEWLGFSFNDIKSSIVYKETIPKATNA